MDIDLEAILRTFKSECDEHLVRMEEALIVLETDPDDAKCLEAIFRGAHTIKGNAAGLGYSKSASLPMPSKNCSNACATRSRWSTRQESLCCCARWTRSGK